MSLLSAPRLVHRTVGRAVHQAVHWPEESQLQARRNALVASTALARHRAEREDVADFLAGRATDRAPRPAPTSHHAHG